MKQDRERNSSSSSNNDNNNNNNNNSVALVSDHRLLAKLVSTFSDGEYTVVSSTDPYGCNLGLLDRNHYFFHLALHLYSRG
jgi:hypothetical protein